MFRAECRAGALGSFMVDFIPIRTTFFPRHSLLFLYLILRVIYSEICPIVDSRSWIPKESSTLERQ